MANIIKEPSIKLIPSDPMTNTILIIYCVSSTGASVPYKSSWRRVHPKRNKVEDIKHHNASSYRCSPLDIDYFIEATVYYQHQNVQTSRIVQSNLVKVSRQLKERRIYMRQPILCRIVIEEISLQMKLFVQDHALHMNPVEASQSSISTIIPISDLHVEVQSNPTSFKMTFKQKIQEFTNFVSQIIGWKPQLKNQDFTLSFGSDINRDFILLGIAEAIQKVQKIENQGLHFPISSRTLLQKNGKMTTRYKQQKERISKNKSQNSISPSNSYKDKYKPVGKLMDMKKSYTKIEGQNNKKIQKTDPLTPGPKLEANDKKQDRQYLNVFEDDDLELLNTPIQSKNISSTQIPKRPKTPAPQGPSDQPSINLRGSFQQLQKSFNSNVNDEMLDRAFGGSNSRASKKMQDQIDRLRKENQSLKRHSETIATLTKQNNSLKRKYLEMKEEINRLEMERKVILTDKLRCEVNWHKEIQEKQQLKRELQHLKQTAKNSGYGYMQRSAKTYSFHDVAANERKNGNRDNSRSPNPNFYH